MDALVESRLKPFIVRLRATHICCRASSMNMAIG
jgi:hypothetical protein